MANIGADYDVVLVARSDGVLAADVRPLVYLSVTAIVEDDGRREQGFAGGGGRHDLAYYDRGASGRLCAPARSTRHW